MWERGQMFMMHGQRKGAAIRAAALAAEDAGASFGSLWNVMFA